MNRNAFDMLFAWDDYTDKKDLIIKKKVSEEGLS